MKIKYGGLDLYDSKSFLIYGLGETEVALEDDEGSVTFVIDICENKKSDDDSPENPEFTMVGESRLIMKLTNWSNPLGTTVHEPIHIGSIHKRNMYLMFSVRKIGENQVREINLSLYLGSEVQNGED